jgi:hypothetical protein
VTVTDVNAMLHLLVEAVERTNLPAGAEVASAL